MVRFELLREWQHEAICSPWSRRLLERRAAEQRRQDFAPQANRFVRIWRKVMDNHQRNGVFNVMDGRALSKFRDLESTGWPN
jgi:hypothetical protein